MTAKKIPELKFKYCPFCFTETVLDPEKESFYLCPNPHCRSEIWHDPMDEAVPVKANPAPEYICRSLVSDVPGGSSSGKTYGKKDKMRKPTTHQIYEKLCGK